MRSRGGGFSQLRPILLIGILGDGVSGVRHVAVAVAHPEVLPRIRIVAGRGGVDPCMCLHGAGGITVA